MLAASEHDFIDLHTQHFTRVYRYIAYRINDLPRAEELASDVFRIAWEKQPAEPPGIGWLLATARKLLSNEYKGRRRRLELVDRLKERDREVLMLSYWDDLTTAELAQTLGCSPSAAAVRLHRARKAFASVAPAQLMTERKG
jgi:DNA-directed RNA polymerase specialized sigma24 family protein